MTGPPADRSVVARSASWAAERSWAIGVGTIALVAGIALRWWILGTPLGMADLDESTVGVQAGFFNHGKLSPFFLNQPYGGTLETALVAVVFRLFGTSVVTLKLVPMALALVAAGLSYQLAVKLRLNRTGQWAVPILVWLGPAYAVLFSTKERGFYGVALVLAAAIPLVVLRLEEAPTVSDGLLLGALLGLGWWQTPLVFLIAVPACVWLVCVRSDAIRALWWGIPTAVIGALPWIWWNAHHGWSSMRQASSFGTSWWDRFFDWLLRMQVVLGIETPFDGNRSLIGFRWAGLILLAVVVIGAALRTKDPAPSFLLTMVIGYGVLYAMNSLAAGVGEDPRYTYLMVPIVAVCLGALLPDVSSNPLRALAVLVVGSLAVASTAWGLAGVRDATTRPDPNYFLASPGIQEVADVLEARGVRAVISDTAGMQLAFLTDQRVVGESFSVPRVEAYERRARAAAHSTYVLDSGLLDNVDRLVFYAATHHIGYEQVSVGKWRIFFLDARVTPPQAGLRVFGGQLGQEWKH